MSKVAAAGAGIRVAVFVPNLKCGGAEKNSVKLANGLADRGHQVSLIVVEGGGDLEGLLGPAVEKVVLLSAAQAARLAAWPPARAAAALISLISWLRRRPPVVLLPRLNYATFLALLAARLIRPSPPVLPTVSSNQVASQRYAHTFRLRLRYRIYSALYRRLLPGADRVIAVSRGIARDLTERFGVPANKLEIIDQAAVVDDDFRRARTRLPSHRWFADRATPLVVAVGRLNTEKDYPTLLHGLKLALEQRAMRLIIVGAGPLKRDLEVLTGRLGISKAVDFVGFQQHPESYLSHADVYVLCSRFEARPTALIEALACGVRVIATRCPHGPEEILDGGRFGRLVPVGDAGALADALVTCLDQQPNLAAQAYVERRHSSEAHTAAYAALIAAHGPALSGCRSAAGDRTAASGGVEWT